MYKGHQIYCFFEVLLRLGLINTCIWVSQVGTVNGNFRYSDAYSM